MIAPTVSKACLGFLLFCTGHPSWRNLLPFGILGQLKVSWKFVLMKSGNMSPLILPLYYSHKTRPFWCAIATINCATLPLEPTWDPLAGCKPSFFNYHAIVHHQSGVEYLPKIISRHFGNFMGKFTPLFKIVLFQ